LRLFALVGVAAAPVAVPTVQLVGFLSGETQRLAVVEWQGSRLPASGILREGDVFNDVSITLIDPAGGFVRFRQPGSVDLQEWKLPGAFAVGQKQNAILLKDAELDTVIAVYQRLAKRTVLRGPELPRSRISLSAGTSLENLLRLLESTLGTNGVAVRTAGELFAFAVRSDQVDELANLPAPPFAGPGRGFGIPGSAVYFQQADQSNVLELYQELAGRTLLRGPNISGRYYTVRNETELTRAEGIWLMESLFRLHGLGVLPQGTNFVIIAQAAQTNRLSQLESRPAIHDEPVKKLAVRLSDAPPKQLLELYVSLAGGTAGSVSPQIASSRLDLRNQEPLTRREAIYALETMAALYGMGFRLQDGGPVDLVPWEELREK